MTKQKLCLNCGHEKSEHDFEEDKSSYCVYDGYGEIDEMCVCGGWKE